MDGWTKLHAKSTESLTLSELLDEEPEAFALWMLMVAQAGVWGRFPAHPKLLKARVAPMVDRLSAARISELLPMLCARDLVTAYEVDGNHYLANTNHFHYNGVQAWHRVGRPECPHPPGFVPPDSLLAYLGKVRAGAYRSKVYADECAKFGVDEATVPEVAPEEQSSGLLPGTTPEEHSSGSARFLPNRRETLDVRRETLDVRRETTDNDSTTDDKGTRAQVRGTDDLPLGTASGGNRPTADTAPADDPADADHMAACNEPELVAAATRYFADTLSPQRATAWAMDALRLTLLPGETVTRADVIAALGNGSGPVGKECTFPANWVDRLRTARASPARSDAGWRIPDRDEYPSGEFKL